MPPEDTTIYETEAEATRDRIAATFDELQDRLSPRTLVRDAVGSVGDAGTELIDSARGLLRDHPMALAAGVLAIGLVLLGGSRLRGATVQLGNDLDGYVDYDDGYADTYQPEATTSDLTPRSARLAALGSRAVDQVEDNPYAAIVAGLAAGALLGALFPASGAENRLLGQSSDRIGAAARAAARAAREQLDQHGLSVDGAREAAQRVASEAKSAVRSVADAARVELKAHDRAA